MESQSTFSQSIGEQVKDLGALKSQPELTFGMKLVGINFNPSGDANVNKAKQLCAELADLVNQSFYEGEQDDKPLSLRHQLFTHTVGEILNAQMNVVKLLTLKY